MGFSDRALPMPGQAAARDRAGLFPTALHHRARFWTKVSQPPAPPRPRRPRLPTAPRGAPISQVGASSMLKPTSSPAPTPLPPPRAPSRVVPFRGHCAKRGPMSSLPRPKVPPAGRGCTGADSPANRRHSWPSAAPQRPRMHAPASSGHPLLPRLCCFAEAGETAGHLPTGPGGSRGSALLTFCGGPPSP